MADGPQLVNSQAEQFRRVLAEYRATDSSFDEAVTAEGVLRPSWQELFQHLGGLSFTEVHRRLAQAQHQMDIDGVAFNPYDARGATRPWSLDAVPLVLEQAEWNQVALGLEQRAKLADLLLLDLLGPQTLLHEKILPPEALFAHPRYFPAYHSLIPRPKRHLQLYAADLARSPSGQWWVTADRTRCPFGLGHILENRLVSSRMFPVPFGMCNVRRLAPFFITLQQTFRELAHRYRENPRIAIWSKGPKSRAYFEDAFLARYLGYALVEGDDLAVRDNKVMLKTLGGLLPVEVLLRRVEDHHCDPAELSGGESYGVSGLLEVIRNGHVSVGNSIGSGLAESPLLMAFMSNICKHFLDQDLLLPSLATWWCGRPDALKYVLSNIDKLTIRRAYRSEDEPPYQPRVMSGEAKARLIERIKAAPGMYIGQEQVNRSTAPVWEQGQLQAWSLALRAFLVAKGDTYETLPGSLARVSPDPDVLLHNMTSGEKSQDVWIVSNQPISPVSLLSVASAQVELKRGGAELPSRAADNLFWLGRNVERAEQLTRLVRITLQQLTSGEAVESAASGLAYACQQAKQLSSEKKIPSSRAALARQLVVNVLNPDDIYSLRNVVRAAHDSAMKVRDRIALDILRAINDLRVIFEANLSSEEVAATEMVSALDLALTSLNAISGLASESMTRTQGWRFLDLGRRLERAYQTARTIRSLIPLQASGVDSTRALEYLLQICDSFMTYRNRYLANMQLAAVLDLLVTDDTNPRSIAYQLQLIHQHVEQLPRPDTQAGMTPEQRLALSQYNAVRLSDVHELAAKDNRSELSSLHKVLNRMLEKLPELSDAISGRFLIHAGLQRHLASASIAENPNPGGMQA
ncbi:MAG: circularly permuted type 2 ATP-grasp protein [Pirellulaceae bacterium]